MGQVQSDEYDCNVQGTQDVADSEINTSSDRADGKCAKSQDSADTSGTTLSSTAPKSTKGASPQQQQQQHVRKLSIVSHRNIQLLSMKPRSEKDALVENLRSRRRSSLINLILGAPSSGPRFSDDLCSLSSHMSECTFGIEFFPDLYHRTSASVASLRLESIEDVGEHPRGVCQTTAGIKPENPPTNQKRRRSSLGSLVASLNCLGAQTSSNPSGADGAALDGSENKLAPSSVCQQQLQQQSIRQQQYTRKPSLASTLASIDLTSSFEQHDRSISMTRGFQRPTLSKTKPTIFESGSQELANSTTNSNNNFIFNNQIESIKARSAKGRVNQSGRVLRRAGSELSLYSTVSAVSATSLGSSISATKGAIVAEGTNKPSKPDALRETKLIIMLQVCLPFILAGFGNMAAGLVLNKVAQWRVFSQVPIFFILLPPFVGLKGNIEMTLASRLSTLSNLNLLDTGYQKKRAYVSNLVLILSQAIGLSLFAALVSILCDCIMAGSKYNDDLLEISILVVSTSVLITSISLVILSSIMMSLAIGLANLIQVNPDNLSTLIAALYGDVSCVLVYGLVADWMYALKEQNLIVWPIIVISSTLVIWPMLLFTAYKLKETHSIALTSIPPMLTSIFISMGSGAVLSKVVGKFKLIALYQPVVNGFGANLIAVQASRVSTWLWCSALRRISITREATMSNVPKKISNSLASFTEPIETESPGDKKKTSAQNLREHLIKGTKTILWSFCNSSPNAIAARLLLVMLIPAHTIYFFVIWILSPENYVVITWQFYSIYIALCLMQVSILLTICEPFMTFLMNRHLDPDVFGISILMALADLTGTLCLAGAFFVLANLGDANALSA